MANTTVNSNLVANLQRKKLYQDVKDALFFENRQMTGEDENSLIYVMPDLKKEPGDRVTMPLTYKMSGDGVTGDNELEGNEEAIVGYDEGVIIDQIRNAVRVKGKLDQQKASYDQWEDARSKAKIWLAEFIERQIFMKLGGVTSTDLTDVNGTTYSARATWSNSAPIVPAADEAAGTGSRYICSDSDGIDAITTEIFTTSLITKAKVKAQLAAPKIRPIRIDGGNYHVMFMHPWQEADLKTDSNSNWEQAQRDAQVRGAKNPIFTGALGVWDGVILHSHEYVPTCQASANFSTSGTACNARVFRAVLCGAQAVGIAETKNGYILVEKGFDYNNKMGFAVGFIGGIQKPAFNSLDYGVISVDTAATFLA